MPRRAREYLGLRLEGYNNIEASGGAGISPRTGSNYLKRFQEEVKRSDVVSIARSYGLDIGDVLKLTGELKKKNFTVGKCEIARALSLSIYTSTNTHTRGVKYEV